MTGVTSPGQHVKPPVTVAEATPGSMTTKRDAKQPFGIARKQKKTASPGPYGRPKDSPTDRGGALEGMDIYDLDWMVFFSSPILWIGNCFTLVWLGKEPEELAVSLVFLHHGLCWRVHQGPAVLVFKIKPQESHQGKANAARLGLCSHALYDCFRSCF